MVKIWPKKWELLFILTSNQFFPNDHAINKHTHTHTHTHRAGMFIGLFTKGFSWTNITKMMADLIEFMIKCFPLQEEWEITYGETWIIQGNFSIWHSVCISSLEGLNSAEDQQRIHIQIHKDVLANNAVRSILSIFTLISFFVRLLLCPFFFVCLNFYLYKIENIIFL